MKHTRMIGRSLITFFCLGAALALAQERPLDNIASRQYQHEVRPLRLALDRWLHELGLQDAGLSIRLVKADDLCIMHGGSAPQVKAAAAARLRAMVNPALSVLEYAMERKEKDIRGALAAAKEVLDRAKPEDDEEGTEVRSTVNFRFFDPPEN